MRAYFSDVSACPVTILLVYSENTKNMLLSIAFMHLQCKEFIKYTSDISSISQRVLLSGPTGLLNLSV